ncbi:MAG: hypothetical protein M3400_10710 [Actinomycetota bacterium]|nr:hypothetical protein [Actinomycetota bacterium]
MSAAEPLETQVDRTVLSWGRTAATVAVVALLFAHLAASAGPIALVPAILGLTAAIVIGVLSRAKARTRRRLFASGAAKPPLWTAAALCLICVLFSGAGLLALLID